VLLHQSLPGGVRLRLPQRTDEAELLALCARHGVDCDPGALLRFDPRERAVVCAARVQTLVGIGSIALKPGAAPDVLVADDDAVREHLRAALAARVRAHPRRRRTHPVRRVLRRARQL
jgi:hypothetical protein